MRPRRVALAGLVFLVIALTLGVRFAPSWTLSLSLAAPRTEKWFATVWDRVAREEITLPARFAGLEADLYRPARPRGALLLIHGLSRAGRRQPDLARLAHLLASQGVLVVVPQFEGLAAFRLTG